MKRPLLALRAIGVALLVGSLAVSALPAHAAEPVDPSSQQSVTEEFATDGSSAAIARAAETYFDALVADEELNAGESIESVNGRYTFVMQPDGNAVVYDGASPTWASSTVGRGDRVVMQGDGNVVIYAADGAAVWASATSDADSVLTIQDDGNLVVYRPDGSPAWATSVNGRIAPPPRVSISSGSVLQSGASLVSPDGRFRAVMQADGNFVEYGPDGVFWASMSLAGGSTLAVQSDGNVVISAPGGRAVWSTATSSGGAVALTMQNDGDLVVSDSGGNRLWSSREQRVRDTMFGGDRLEVNEKLTSRNGRYRAVMQSDGNFVVYGPQGASWSTGTSGGGSYFSVAVGGELRVMSRDPFLITWYRMPFLGYIVNVGPEAPWAKPVRVVMQDDGNLVEYDATGRVMWAMGR
jgi:hypothetical protein